MAVLPCGAKADVTGYTCAQYMANLVDGAKPDKDFYMALGLMYGAYMMARWDGDFDTDDDRMNEFDRTVLKVCNRKPSAPFARVLMESAAAFKR